MADDPFNVPNNTAITQDPRQYIRYDMCRLIIAPIRYGGCHVVTYNTSSYAHIFFCIGKLINLSCSNSMNHSTHKYTEPQLVSNPSTLCKCDNEELRQYLTIFRTSSACHCMT